MPARNKRHEGYPMTVGRMVKQRLASATVIVDLPRHNLSTVDDMIAGSSGSTRFPHGDEPRLRPVLAEGDVLQIGPDLEPGRLYKLYCPTLGKGDFDFLP